MAKSTKSRSAKKTESAAPGRDAASTRNGAAGDAKQPAASAAAAKGKHLVIVESPSKAKTINKYLGSGYIVMASVGHVRDLPSKNPKGDKGNYSFVLRGYVRKWLTDLDTELARLDLVKSIMDSSRQARVEAAESAGAVKG